MTSMNTEKTSFIASLKEIRPRDLIYPGIVVLFLILVAVLFIIASRFISANINKILITTEVVPDQAINLDHYYLTAKKLRIATSTPGIASTTPATTTVKTVVPPPSRK